MRLLQQLSEEISEAATAVLPAIVQINSWRKEPKVGMKRLFSSDKLLGSSGTGVILKNNGVIITNAHVVKDADRVSVRLNDGRVFESTIIRHDPISDVAVLKIPASGLFEADFALERDPYLGEMVLTVGHPLDRTTSITFGIISSPSCFEPHPDSGYPAIFIQIDAAINPGNSGGALVGSDGKVLGINTWGFRPEDLENIAFAIPIKRAVEIADDLIEHGKVRYGSIGILGSEYDLPAKVVRDHAIDQTTGILVTEVKSPNYTASKHIDEGFEIRREVLESDFILKMGEKRVETLQDYLTVLKNNVGRDLKLTMLSGDDNIYYTFVEVAELKVSE